ncbi:MAG: hypothetical protein M1825_003102 [Sarcosagium campestre]|nr:MAG: hypothetical protein M1825_003102 [Sarcosagium campestre]
MYSASHPPSTSLNGMGNDMMGGPGTINPAALNSAVLSNATASGLATDSSPRGVKRSRSPDRYSDAQLTGDAGDNDDEQKRRKRGRPPKAKGANVSESPGPPATAQLPSNLQNQNHTPQQQPQGLPQQQTVATPTQASPPKATPTKAVVKALPTVRDHTTDQLGADGDEYIPREYDEAGEKKVNATGHPLDGREYKCRTFFVPNRGDKLFMLATECARVLGYRDSYLLFNKNRSLFKIIASQAEKEDLIHQEILPYSYRSRQIAIVTAKSMFRQFGSRVIQHGRRVRDDYWESKARKQGFTEEDLAGEKRPGAAKARETAAAEAASAAAGAAAAAATGQHTDIVYSNGPSHLDSHLQPQPAGAASLAPLPMIQTDDVRLRDYGNVARPRQELSGAAYLDRTQPTPSADIMNHAQHTAEYNKAVTQQRGARSKYMEEYWNKPREVPSNVPTRQQSGGQNDQAATAAAAAAGGNTQLNTPPLTTGGLYNQEAQQAPQTQQRRPPQLMSTQPYSQQQQQQQQQPPHPHPQNPMAQSPVRGLQQASMRPDQMHHRSPSLATGGGAAGHPGNPYYQHQGQMWAPTQPLQSPMSQQHHMPQYSPGAPQPSPHQQSPHQQHQHQHQLQHQHQQQQQAGGPMPGGSIQYPGMPGMGPGGYPGPAGRGIYQPSPTSQHFMHQTTAGPQPGMQGWAPPQPSPHGQQWGWGTSG